jgi:glutaryl-CoA transferase
MGALDGIRVLDVSQVLAGPFCGQLMADNGAEVIRVESLDGDLCRRFPPDRGGQSTTFLAVNRGKRGLALNLKTAEGQDVLHRLAKRADIMIQSFLPSRAKQLGIDHDTISDINGNLIHVTISGYGPTGPLKDKAGLDMMVSAYSGIMGITGDPDGSPARPGTPAIDMGTGMIAYGAAMTALVARGNGKGGQAVNASLMQTALNLLAFNATQWLVEGQVPVREGSGFNKLAPYGAFDAADGQIIVGAPNEAGWQRLCTALDRSDLRDDPRFATNTDRISNRSALDAAIGEILKFATVAEWIERFDAVGAVAAPIHSMDQVFAQEQVKATGMIVEAQDRDGSTVNLVGPPFKLSETPPEPGDAPPHLGEHTETVLQDELGLSDTDIAALREAGAIS